ncbi:transglutaminase domain-containing protein [[Clostridium] fimetarium]|uniref:Transglutaminase-like superfamily protein n=1 Tax=[Clostridium] fimetarium TaxID=99656 RepID=A0A1I0QA35_9FIRM|nr:transglutaminase domain-containing protein [[Clostridium] fimetarium]SEW23884.1 Transglutaminase-like superfamily protein [[Clostridium] fimetarium]
MKNKADIGKGVTFIDVNVRQVNPEKTSQYLCNFLPLYFGTLGTISILVSSFSFEINIGLLIIMSFFICLIPYITLYVIKKRFFAYLIVSGLFCLFLAIFCRQIIVSGAISINTIIKGISIPYKLYIPMLDIPKFSGIGYVDMQLFIYFLTFIISMVTGHVVFVRHSLILAMILPVSITSFCISFDVIPSAMSLVLVMAYLMSVLSMNTKPKLELNPSVPAIVCGMLFGVSIVIFILIPSFNYHRFAPFDTVRVWVMNTFDPLSIDNLKNTDTTHGGINGGQLGAFDNIVYTNSSMFTLRAASNGGNLYYRSFYGASYSDNSWGDLPIRYEQKYTALVGNSKPNLIDGNIETTTLLNILDSDEQLQQSVEDNKFNYDTDVQKQEYEINYINADMKYWYIPYASSKLTDYKSSLDGYPVNNNKGSYYGYSYNVGNLNYGKIKGLVDTYKGTNTSMKAYVKWEAQYRQYVYDAYTYLPEDSLEDIKAEGKKHLVTTETEKQIYINQVIENLATNYKYSLNPGKVPDGKDFVEYFLNESKEGYCTYFATAATLMFRAAGIPARYVEGYTVFDSDIKSGVKTSSYYFKTINGQPIKTEYSEYTTTVKDSNAHAWVEVYEDGYGWVPIEVTPGMSVADQINRNSLLNEYTQSSTSAPTNESSVADTSAESLDDLNDSTTVSTENGMNSEDKDSWIVILVATMILVIAGTIIIWYLMYRKARKLLFELLTMKTENSANSQILNVYKYFERLCRFLGVSKSESMNYEDYAKYLNEKLKYFSECDIDAIINTVLMVRFSNSKALEEEALCVTVGTFKLREMVYANLSKIDKIKFRYFYKL